MSLRKDQFHRWFEIRWAEDLGDEKCPYIRRWVLTLFGYSLRVHHWLNSDDQRHLHDHAWWFLTFVLKGGYTDIHPYPPDEILGATGFVPYKRDYVKRWSFRYRPAEHRHTVEVDRGGAWTILLAGPKTRDWGFYVPGREKLLRPLRYFSRYGHHPCE